MVKDPFINDDIMGDDEFNFDNLDNIDSGDMSFGGFEEDDSSSNRNPKSSSEMLTKVLGSGMQAASATSVSTLGTRIAREFPTTKNLADEGMNFASGLMRLKDDFTKELRPTVNQMKVNARRALPLVEDALPKTFMDKITKFLDQDDVEGFDSTAPTKKDTEEMVIRDTLREVFKAETAINKKRNQREAVDNILNRQMGVSHHKELTQILRDVRTFTMHQAHFNNAVQIPYMKKMLELKYQHLWTSKDLLEVAKLSSQALEKKLDEIRHNTSLPEYAKEQASEVYKAQMRDKMIGTVQDYVSNFSGNVLGNIKERVLGPGKEMGDMFADISSSILDGIEMEREMADMTGEKAPTAGNKIGMALASALGGVGGNKAADQVLGMLSKHRNAIELTAGNAKLNGILALNKAAEGGTDNELLNTIAALLVPTLDKSAGAFNNRLFNDPTSPAQYDVATRTAIIETIPGFLGKILQQITTFNTGKSAEELVYDERTRDFITVSALQKDRTDRIFGAKEDRTEQLRAGVEPLRGAVESRGNKNLSMSFNALQKELGKVFYNLSVLKDYPLVNTDYIREAYHSANPAYNEYIVAALKGVSAPIPVLEVLYVSLFKEGDQVDTSTYLEWTRRIQDYITANEGYKSSLGTHLIDMGHTRHMKNIVSSGYDGSMMVDDEKLRELMSGDPASGAPTDTSKKKWLSGIFKKSTGSSNADPFVSESTPPPPLTPVDGGPTPIDTLSQQIVDSSTEALTVSADKLKDVLDEIPEQSTKMKRIGATVSDHAKSTLQGAKDMATDAWHRSNLTGGIASDISNTFSKVTSKTSSKATDELGLLKEISDNTYALVNSVAQIAKRGGILTRMMRAPMDLTKATLKTSGAVAKTVVKMPFKVAAMPFKAVGKVGKAIRGDSANRFEDIYRLGAEHEEPIVTKKQLKQGLVFEDGKIITHVREINRPVYDPYKDENGNKRDPKDSETSPLQVITSDDLKQGLVTASGVYLTVKSSAMDGASKAAKGMIGGTIAIAAGIGGAAASVVKSGVRTTSDVVRRQLQPFTDVYTKNLQEGFILLAKGSDLKRVGVYKDGKPLKNVYDIDGPVWNAYTGELLIEEEDIKNGLYDAQGNSLNRIGLKIGNVISKLGSATLGAMTAAVAGVGAVATAATSLAKAAFEKKNPYVDVFVKGEVDPAKPVLSAKGLSSGRYCYSDGKLVTSAYGIDQPVYSVRTTDGERKVGNILIDNEDLKKGLVDVHGDSLSTWQGRSVVGKAVTGIANIAKGAFKVAGSVVGGMIGGVSSLLPGTGSRSALKEFVGDKLDVIIAILSQRLPDPKPGYRSTYTLGKVDDNKQLRDALVSGTIVSGIVPEMSSAEKAEVEKKELERLSVHTRHTSRMKEKFRDAERKRLRKEKGEDLTGSPVRDKEQGSLIGRLLKGAVTAIITSLAVRFGLKHMGAIMEGLTKVLTKMGAITKPVTDVADNALRKSTFGNKVADGATSTKNTVAEKWGNATQFAKDGGFHKAYEVVEDVQNVGMITTLGGLGGLLYATTYGSEELEAMGKHKEANELVGTNAGMLAGLVAGRGGIIKSAVFSVAGGWLGGKVGEFLSDEENTDFRDKHGSKKSPSAFVLFNLRRAAYGFPVEKANEQLVDAMEVAARSQIRDNAPVSDDVLIGWGELLGMYDPKMHEVSVEYLRKYWNEKFLPIFLIYELATKHLGTFPGNEDADLKDEDKANLFYYVKDNLNKDKHLRERAWMTPDKKGLHSYSAKIKNNEITDRGSNTKKMDSLMREGLQDLSGRSEMAGHGVTAGTIGAVAMGTNAGRNLMAGGVTRGANALGKTKTGTAAVNLATTVASKGAAVTDKAVGGAVRKASPYAKKGWESFKNYGTGDAARFKAAEIEATEHRRSRKAELRSTRKELRSSRWNDLWSGDGISGSERTTAAKADYKAARSMQARMSSTKFYLKQFNKMDSGYGGKIGLAMYAWEAYNIADLAMAGKKLEAAEQAVKSAGMIAGSIVGVKAGALAGAGGGGIGVAVGGVVGGIVGGLGGEYAVEGLSKRIGATFDPEAGPGWYGNAMRRYAWYLFQQRARLYGVPDPRTNYAILDALEERTAHILLARPEIKAVESGAPPQAPKDPIKIDMTDKEALDWATKFGLNYKGDPDSAIRYWLMWYKAKFTHVLFTYLMLLKSVIYDYEWGDEDRIEQEAMDTISGQLEDACTGLTSTLASLNPVDKDYQAWRKAMAEGGEEYDMKTKEDKQRADIGAEALFSTTTDSKHDGDIKKEEYYTVLNQSRRKRTADTAKQVELYEKRHKIEKVKGAEEARKRLLTDKEMTATDAAIMIAASGGKNNIEELTKEANHLLDMARKEAIQIKATDSGKFGKDVSGRIGITTDYKQWFTEEEGPGMFSNKSTNVWALHKFKMSIYGIPATSMGDYEDNVEQLEELTEQWIVGNNGSANFEIEVPLSRKWVGDGTGNKGPATYTNPAHSKYYKLQELMSTRFNLEMFSNGYVVTDEDGGGEYLLSWYKKRFLPCYICYRHIAVLTASTYTSTAVNIADVYDVIDDAKLEGMFIVQAIMGGMSEGTVNILHAFKELKLDYESYLSWSEYKRGHGVNADKFATMDGSSTGDYEKQQKYLRTAEKYQDTEKASKALVSKDLSATEAAAVLAASSNADLSIDKALAKQKELNKEVIDATRKLMAANPALYGSMNTDSKQVNTKYNTWFNEKEGPGVAFSQGKYEWGLFKFRAHLYGIDPVIFESEILDLEAMALDMYKKNLDISKFKIKGTAESNYSDEDEGGIFSVFSSGISGLRDVDDELMNILFDKFESMASNDKNPSSKIRYIRMWFKHRFYPIFLLFAQAANILMLKLAKRGYEGNDDLEDLLDTDPEDAQSRASAIMEGLSVTTANILATYGNKLILDAPTYNDWFRFTQRKDVDQSTYFSKVTDIKAKLDAEEKDIQAEREKKRKAKADAAKAAAATNTSTTKDTPTTLVKDTTTATTAASTKMESDADAVKKGMQSGSTASGTTPNATTGGTSTTGGTKSNTGTMTNLNASSGTGGSTVISGDKTMGKATMVGTIAPPTKVDRTDGSQLGDSVKKYESGDKGSDAIGWDRMGGTSYGKYQIAARPGGFASFVRFARRKGYTQFHDDMVKAVGKPLPKDSANDGGWGDTGSKSGAPVDVWMKYAADGTIGKLEHDYIKSTWYDRELKQIANEVPDAHAMITASPALQDMIWSMAVQHADKTSQIVAKVWKPGMATKDFVNAVYAERATRFGGSTASVQESARNRMKNESGDIIALFEKEDIQRKSMAGAGGTSTGAGGGGVAGAVTASGSAAAGGAGGMSSALVADAGSSGSGSGTIGGEAGGQQQAGTGGAKRPIQGGRLTSGWLRSDGSPHGGLDFAGNKGAPIYAFRAGKVVRSGYSSSYGNVVYLHHPETQEQTRYAHMVSTPMVKMGQEVSAGQQLGVQGNTGRSRGDHLHFEIRKGKGVDDASNSSTKVNPEPILKGLGISIARTNDKRAAEEATEPAAATAAPEPAIDAEAPAPKDMAEANKGDESKEAQPAARAQEAALAELTSGDKSPGANGAGANAATGDPKVKEAAAMLQPTSDTPSAPATTEDTKRVTRGDIGFESALAEIDEEIAAEEKSSPLGLSSTDKAAAAAAPVAETKTTKRTTRGDIGFEAALEEIDQEDDTPITPRATAMAATPGKESSSTDTTSSKSSDDGPNTGGPDPSSTGPSDTTSIQVEHLKTLSLLVKEISKHTGTISGWDLPSAISTLGESMANMSASSEGTSAPAAQPKAATPTTPPRANSTRAPAHIPPNKKPAVSNRVVSYR